MRRPAPLVRAPDAQSLDFAWLVRLRWIAVTGQLVTLVAVSRLPGLRLPLGPLLVVVGLTALSNLALALWRRRHPQVPEAAIGAVLLLDVGLLTALLWLSGGPYNPFSFLYLVHVGLAAAILRPAFIWTIVVSAAAAFGSLFLLRSPPLMQGMDAAAHLRLHLHGMWVAFTVSAVTMAFFVGRVRRALVERDRALVEARERGVRAERLASLATLAAGAAHELSTPLGTIAVVARELERQLDGATVAGAADDARLIRDEVNRCRRILDHLVSDAGESAGEPFRSTDPESVARAALDASPHGASVRIERAEGPRAPLISVPPRALSQALRGLVDNAVEAAGPGGHVVVQVGTEGDRRVFWEVADEGPGMDAEALARAGEPFFTTKAPGRGMGLGLFLARTLAERLGGELTIVSAPREGTRVRIGVPAPATPRRIDPTSERTSG